MKYIHKKSHVDRPRYELLYFDILLCMSDDAASAAASISSCRCQRVFHLGAILKTSCTRWLVPSDLGNICPFYLWFIFSIFSTNWGWELDSSYVHVIRRFPDMIVTDCKSHFSVQDPSINTKYWHDAWVHDWSLSLSKQAIRIFCYFPRRRYWISYRNKTLFKIITFRCGSCTFCRALYCSCTSRPAYNVHSDSNIRHSLVNRVQ